MKVCDLTQFYSPLSGGVKRYVHEKIRYIQSTPNDEHVLVIPGARSERIEAERSRIYSIRSPLLSRTSRYRALLNLRAIEEILEREQPDLIESGDPYQVAWKAIASGSALRIPVVGFYHSHFPEAYLRTTARFLGRTATEFTMDLARRYVRQIYNQFEATLVPSVRLGNLLTTWGVQNVHAVDLGVNIEIFRPDPDDRVATRASLGIPPEQCLLLYVGRLAHEKNTQTLFAAFAALVRREPRRYHLLIVGDGLQRAELRKLQKRVGSVTWFQYCTDPMELARYYRAAELLVHPGRAGNFWPNGAGEPGLRDAGGRHSRQLHGPDHFWQPGTLGTGKFRDGPGGCGCGGRQGRAPRDRSGGRGERAPALRVAGGFCAIVPALPRRAGRVSRRLKRASAGAMQRHLPCEKRAAH